MPANRCLPRQSHHLKKQNDFNKKKSSYSQPLLPSRQTFTTATQIAGAERFWRRTSSRRAHWFLFWGCAVLCLPKPPSHHTPNHTATQVTGAVRGACKHTGATIQRFVFHDFPFSPIWILNYFDRFFCFLGLWVLIRFLSVRVKWIWL